ITRVQLVPAAEPNFVLLGNNWQRLVVTPVGALKLGRFVSVGAGATMLADTAGHGIDFKVGIVGGDKVGAGALDVSLPTRAAPVVGLILSPTRWLRLGASYRGEIDLGIKLDILAHVDLAGTITGDALITLRAINFYTPHKVSLG